MYLKDEQQTTIPQAQPVQNPIVPLLMQTAVQPAIIHTHSMQSTSHDVATTIDGTHNTITHQRNVDNRVTHQPQITVDNSVTVNIQYHHPSKESRGRESSRRTTADDDHHQGGSRRHLPSSPRDTDQSGRENIRREGESGRERSSGRDYSRRHREDIHGTSRERTIGSSKHYSSRQNHSRGDRKNSREANIGEGERRHRSLERESRHRPSHREAQNSVDVRSTETEGVGDSEVIVGAGEPQTTTRRFTEKLKEFGKSLNERMVSWNSSRQTGSEETKKTIPIPTLPIKQFSKASHAGLTNSNKQNLLEILRLYVSESKTQPLDQMHFCAMWACATGVPSERYGLPLLEPSDIRIGDVGFLSPSGVFKLKASVRDMKRGATKLSPTLAHKHLEDRQYVTHEAIEVMNDMDILERSAETNQPTVLAFNDFPGDYQRFLLAAEGPLHHEFFEDTEPIHTFLSENGKGIHQQINTSVSSDVEGPLVVITSTTRTKGRIVRFMMFPLPKSFPRRVLIKVRSEGNLVEDRPPYRLPKDSEIHRSGSFRRGRFVQSDYCPVAVQYPVLKPKKGEPRDVLFINGIAIPPFIPEPAK